MFMSRMPSRATPRSTSIERSRSRLAIGTVKRSICAPLEQPDHGDREERSVEERAEHETRLTPERRSQLAREEAAVHDKGVQAFDDEDERSGVGANDQQ